MRIRLRTKLLAFGIFAVIVPLGVALLPTVLTFRDAQKNAALERQRQIANMAAGEIEHFLILQFHLLQEIEPLLSPEFFADENLQRVFMQRVLFRNDSIVDLVLTDSNGNELFRQNRYYVIRKDDLTNIAQSVAFKETRAHGQYLGPLIFQEGLPLFILGRSVADARGNHQGMIIAKVDARIMQEAVQQTTAAKGGGRTYIVNEDGSVVAHPNVSQVLAQKDFSFLPIIAALKHDQNAIFPSIYKNEIGHKVLGSWAPVTVALDNAAATRWYVVAEERASEALRYVNRIIVLGFGVLFFVFIFAALGAWLISRWITHPLEQVHLAVARLGRGKLSERAYVRTSDEIKDLAEGFNQMAENLGASISTLEKNRHTIAAERSKVIALIESLTVGVMLINPEGKIDLANAAAREFLKLPSNIHSSQNLVQLLKNTDKGAPGPDNTKTSEIRFRTPRDRYLRVTKIAGQGLREESAFEGTLYVLEDLTKEKQIQEREHFVSEMKSNFVTVAAHQMRTPLSAIKWLLGMILDGEAGKLTVKHKEYAQKIQQSNERMIRLISHLLDLSRIEEGRFGYEFAPVEIVGIVEKVVALLIKTAEQYKITLSFEPGAQKLPAVRGDGEKLKIVVENLIQNALAYTQKGGKVKVKAWQDKNNIMVSVEDTGIGIPKEEQKKLFAKFFRGQEALKMRTDGAGLGLAITRDIVREHGGKIWFESVSKKGTTFYFSLPILA